MLSVEECLEALDTLENRDVIGASGQTLKITNSFDRRFIGDVTTHTRAGKAISTSQGQVGLKLIQRYQGILADMGYQPLQLNQLTTTPNYRTAPYQSTVLPREVRWAGNNVLVFRCKFNDAVIQDIKRLKSANLFEHQNYPLFLRDAKLWLVNVNSGNWERVMDVIKRHRFHFDDTVAEYFTEVANSAGQRSQVASTDTEITVTARDDDFLAGWINAIEKLEG